MQAILAAAEDILGSEGYDATTLNAIAERAAIPTASVYHYFNDRSQVVIELLSRHIGALSECITRYVEDELNKRRVKTLRNAVDAVMTPMIEYFRAQPGSIALWIAGDDAAVAMVAEFDERTAEQFWHLAIDLGLIRKKTPLLPIQLAFQAGNRLFDVAFRLAPSVGDDAVLAEASRMLTAYLETYAPKASPLRPG